VAGWFTAGRLIVGSLVVGWWFLDERDLQVDLDPPAGDAHLLDDEP